MDNTQTSPVKKRSSFKRGLIYLIVLGALGGGGYVAYQQGALDGYLPAMLQAKVEPAPVAVAEPAKPPVSDAPVLNAGDMQAALNQMQGTQAGTPAASPNIANNAPAVAAPAPSIVLSINGAAANALLSAYDAQWQWQMIEQHFKQQADAASTLQQVQSLKAQLQASNAAAFAPTLAAITQLETQLQAWLPLPTATYSAALTQSLLDVDSMAVKMPEGIDVASSAGELTWWQKTLASLKGVIEIKRVDEQKNRAALDASTQVLVKQALVARLNLAQWAAQNGQWTQAQSHAKAAQAMAEQWADANALLKLKPLLDASSFPAAPDFATVSAALAQARVQLSNEARAAQTLPAPAVVEPAAAVKGGA
ncbi:MAG: hypothetical protein ACRCV6_04990 [Formosimonas sp.]